MIRWINAAYIFTMPKEVLSLNSFNFLCSTFKKENLWSLIKFFEDLIIYFLKFSYNIAELVRKMGDHRPMRIAPSRWSWNRFKDMLNFYFMLGIIPAGLLILSANLFVGPAKLAEIPEGYTPQHWEYYSVIKFLLNQSFLRNIFLDWWFLIYLMKYL